jgi:uncharacterized lipoprotein YajG
MKFVIKSITAALLSLFLFAGCTKEYITNIVSGPAPTC